LREHIYKIRNCKKNNNFIYKHFLSSKHSLDYVTCQPLEQIVYEDNATVAQKNRARFTAELNWIKKLQTPYPLGLNDNIYKQGNLSKDPDIDVFSLVHERKRRARSHGKRINGNIKRKRKDNTTIDDLYNILKLSGRHTMLSKLVSLSVPCLKELDTIADNIYIRSNPLYETASLIQSYTSHFLHPHIDKEVNHIRHFMKLRFINKGIDFIDIPSILRNDTVCSLMPKYFDNLELPIISYKYNKPIRNTIFNYNKITSDLNISDPLPNMDNNDCSTMS